MVSDAAKCDHCDALFVPAQGDVQVEYSVRNKDRSLTAFSPDDGHADWFDLCAACSAEFLIFMRHKP